MNIKMIMIVQVFLLFFLTGFGLAGEVDSDGDGLSDFQEIHKYHTNPFKKDTDGDGVPDGDWKARREHTYTVRTVMKFMPPFDSSCLNDDFQDARVLEETKDYIKLEVVLYPLCTANQTIEGNPNWQKDYSGMSQYLKPGITANWDAQMKQTLLAKLNADGIDIQKLTDKEVVEKVTSWLLKKSRSLDNVFTTYYVYFPEGKPKVYPGLEESFKMEFERDKANYTWSMDRHFDRELLGRGMFYNHTHGSCTSFAIYQTTVLRALGIPTRIVLVTPLVDPSEEDQVQLVRKGITHHQVRATLLEGLERNRQGFVAHTFNEVYVGNRWRRLNYNHLGQNILDPHCFGLHVHLYTFTDWSEANLAATWGYRYAKGIRTETFKGGNPYSALAISDLFGRRSHLPNPPAAVPARNGTRPNIFVMVPANSSMWQAVFDITQDAVHNRTGRVHDQKSYDEIFSDTFAYHTKPGDLLVLLFTLDTQDRLPARYADLLPRPWPEIETALQQSKTQELKGTSRKLNVIVLAAPTKGQLWRLIGSTNLLMQVAQRERPGGAAVEGPDYLTISKAYWFDSKDRPNWITKPQWMNDRDGHILLHVDEWNDNEGIEQYQPFYQNADKRFVLKSGNYPGIHAFAERGYWKQEFYLKIPETEFKKMQPGIPYTVQPVNSHSQYQWKMRERVTIRK